MHRVIGSNEKCTQTFTLGFKPVIPEFAQPQTEHALNHTAAQIGNSSVTCNILPAVM
jgi:hypothetical protein